MILTRQFPSPTLARRTSLEFHARRSRMQGFQLSFWPAALLCALAASVSAQEVQGQRSSGPPMIVKAPNVTQDMLNGAHTQGVNWLHTNGGYEQHRYYPGTQINTGNVKRLRPAFMFQ